MLKILGVHYTVFLLQLLPKLIHNDKSLNPSLIWNILHFQEKFKKEQQEMKQKFMDDIKRSDKVEAQKKEQVSTCVNLQ